ncbi:universal stress protein [Candidatus Sumerlaeota bacterium]|nr:universal stress protein [Candidatus Sumerlaeota bacterium]
MKVSDTGRIKKIILPTAGGPNARLAFEWASCIVKQNKGQLVLLYIIRTEIERKTAEHQLSETKKGVQYEPERVKDKIVLGKNIVKTIIKESEGFDLIVIGASRESLWKRIRFGTIPEKILRSSDVPVLVVKKYEGVILSWLRRFIAG